MFARLLVQRAGAATGVLAPSAVCAQTPPPAYPRELGGSRSSAACGRGKESSAGAVITVEEPTGRSMDAETRHESLHRHAGMRG
jgi:hypothetical protein